MVLSNLPKQACYGETLSQIKSTSLHSLYKLTTAK